jgi:hypothetical protein
MKKILFASLILLATFANVSAQNFTPCVTDEYHRRLLAVHPALAAAEEQANRQAREQLASVTNKKAPVRYIPVVFHVIHENGVENIAQSQIMDALRVINEDYRKKAGTNGGSSTDALAADMEIEFRLAQYDPSGNKHDGIIRIENSMTNEARDNVKALSYWDATRYLNIWVVKSIENTGSTGGTVLGFSSFPMSLNFSPLEDGIVIRSDQVGMIGSGQTSQAGRTFTHEAGHWLGLYHPFQEGCFGGTASNCSSRGDQVCDTPPVSDASFGCQVNRNSCSNDSPNLPDLIKNYMDYADGTCMNMFTTGQKTRVNGISFSGGSYRVKATSTSNLNTTGLDANGNYVAVNAATIKAPYSYTFENASPAADGWVINNFNIPDNGWQRSTIAAQAGSASISMRNFSNSLALLNSRDGFQSPEIDLSTVANPFLSFYYAYAQKSTANNDILNITISNDFGMTETNLFSKSGSTLSTAGDPTSQEFIPTAGQWKMENINLTPYKTYTHARFRFEFLNRRGNNAYVDNFSISNGSLTGLEEAAKASVKFAVQPNPMQDFTYIYFNLEQSKQVKISLLDMLGREMSIAADAQLASGQHEISISRNNLRPGMYFIRFEAGEHTFSHKLLVN